MFIIFDLDGTLALNEHRQHFVQQAKKDWKSFYNACDGDQPNLPVIAVALALKAVGHRVEIWSGRSNEVSQKTFNWLEKHGLSHLKLRSREENDFTPDHELKALWLANEPRKPDLIFDDRNSVVKMWRSKGIVCAQTAEGDF